MPKLPDEELPDGVWETEDIHGRPVYWARCRACRRDFEWHFDCTPFEIDPFYILCFGSQTCVP